MSYLGDRKDLQKFSSPLDYHQRATKYILCPEEGHRDEGEKWHLSVPYDWGEGQKEVVCMSHNQGPDGNKHVSTRCQHGEMKPVNCLAQYKKPSEYNWDYYRFYTWLKGSQKLSPVVEIKNYLHFLKYLPIALKINYKLLTFACKCCRTRCLVVSPMSILSHTTLLLC